MKKADSCFAVQSLTGLAPFSLSAEVEVEESGIQLAAEQQPALFFPTGMAGRRIVVLCGRLHFQARMGCSRNGFGDSPLDDVESELSDLEQLWKKALREVIARRIAPEGTPEDAGWPPEQWSKFGLLHFACHGKFVEERPLDSALRLGRDAVRGSELFATKLNATVVVLSACALGQRAQRYGDTDVVSEEWIGLYLPLFYAGARSLVVSLWDANSQVARQFMVSFHVELARGKQPHLAFRNAMLQVGRRLPARWANWCLVGLP